MISTIPAFADGGGMALTATADKGSTVITITGKTSSDQQDVTLTVISPSGNNLVTHQITPDAEGLFDTAFEIDYAWAEDGLYEIKAQQGTSSTYRMSVEVEVNNMIAQQTSETDSNLPEPFQPIETNIARDAGLEISTAETELGSDTIVVTGSTDRISTDITLTVTAPNGNKVSADRISPMLDGMFTAILTTGGPLWTQDGIYMVTVQQFNDPKYITTAEVDIRDGYVATNKVTPADPDPTQIEPPNKGEDVSNQGLIRENRQLREQVAELAERITELEMIVMEQIRVIQNLVNGMPEVPTEVPDPVVVIDTELGQIVIEFFPDDAPMHVQNFITLAENGFYDGTLFHRIIPSFMIQGGDPNTAEGDPSTWGMGRPDTMLDAEFNDIKHNRGIVSMARSADPNSAGSQFFIVHADSNFLDEQYTVFGRIVTQESLDTLDRIASVATDSRDRPLDPEPVRITKVEVVSQSDIPDYLDQPAPERTRTVTPAGK